MKYGIKYPKLAIVKLRKYNIRYFDYTTVKNQCKNDHCNGLHKDCSIIFSVEQFLYLHYF